jgi:hypothetical protein
MPNHVQPPRYSLTADTVEASLNALHAAQQLIEGHLAAVAPGSPRTQFKAAKSAPMVLRIDLDLGPLLDRTNGTIDGLTPRPEPAKDEGLPTTEGTPSYL